MGGDSAVGKTVCIAYTDKPLPSGQSSQSCCPCPPERCWAAWAASSAWAAAIRRVRSSDTWCVARARGMPAEQRRGHGRYPGLRQGVAS
jgi:hypothetical protein